MSDTSFIPLGYKTFEGWDYCLKKKLTKRKILNIYDIPLDIFSFHILRYFEYNDIVRFSSLSRKMHTYFNQDSIWRDIFIRSKIKTYYDRRLIILSKSSDKKNDTDHWSEKDIKANKCRLVIRNQTENIPFAIYWVRKNGLSVSASLQGQVLPGKCFIAHTLPNHKWVCIPHPDWVSCGKNYSNLGFSFIINVLQLKNFQFVDKNNNKKEIISFVKDILMPRYFKPIKGTMKVRKCFKYSFIGLRHNIITINREINNINDDTLYSEEEIRGLKRRTRYLENSIDRNERRLGDLKYIKRIIVDNP